MVRPPDAASDLETIDLGDDAGRAEAWPRDRPPRRLAVVLVLSTAFVVIAGLAFLVSRSAGGRGSSASNAAVTRPSPSPGLTSAPQPARSGEPVVGRFYPVFGRNGPTTIVLPNGLTFTLSRGASATIGGLGATFFGAVTPKGAACCALSFDVLHASPSDLFATLAPHSLSRPVLVSSALAVQRDVRQVHGRFGILSTGDWTLVASFENGDHTAEADAFVVHALGTWHLRSTPHGAVLRVPAGSTVDNSEADFGSVPDLTDKAVNFVQSRPCQIGRTPTFFGTAADTTGRWCDRGLAVTIEGSRSYVKHAVADLVITHPPEA